MAILTFSFDDGYSELVPFALDLFNNYNISGTVAIISDLIGQTYEGYPLMNTDQISALASAGWEIASHSATHPYLTQVDALQLNYEVRMSKEKLETYGFKINVFVVPFGAYDGRVQNQVSQYYYSCRPSIWGENTQPIDKYNLKSKWVLNTTSFDEMKSWVDSAVANDAWLIIMLHHINHPEREYNISYENLRNIIEYSITAGMDIKNISDVLAPPPPAPAGVSPTLVAGLFAAPALFYIINRQLNKEKFK